MGFSVSGLEFVGLIFCISLYPSLPQTHPHLLCLQHFTKYQVELNQQLTFMDRKSLMMKSLKGNNGGDGRSLMTDNSMKTSGDSWDYNGTNGYYGVDLLGGFSWPPRSYTCSFCKRVFRSAQALGGHMNVHRRDRARLRQSPPWETQTSNFNPNSDPNFPPHIKPSAMLPTFSCSFPPMLTPTSSLSSSTDHQNIQKELGGTVDPSISKRVDLAITMKALKELKEDDCKILEKGEIIMLDLDISLCNKSSEDLDLELRLGYSN